MKAFIIEKGTPIFSVKMNGRAIPVIEEQVMKEQKLYFLEDITVDPIGKHGLSHDNKLVSRFANEGYYGFKLSENSKGFDFILVSSQYIEVS